MTFIGMLYGVDIYANTCEEKRIKAITDYMRKTKKTTSPKRK